MWEYCALIESNESTLFRIFNDSISCREGMYIEMSASVDFAFNEYTAGFTGDVVYVKTLSGGEGVVEVIPVIRDKERINEIVRCYPGGYNPQLRIRRGVGISLEFDPSWYCEFEDGVVLYRGEKEFPPDFTVYSSDLYYPY